ncbi:MAG: macro domain-containing protein [Lachnospiraceae bacterium]|jgi:O-acetyl-ADP-ribose deacetylase (regulator of RNase III)|nr:macro domain-containing protein [Lachnospiraceae bacterium]
MPLTDLFKHVQASEKGPVTVAGLVINPADPASAVQVPVRAVSDILQAAGKLAQRTGAAGGNRITFVKGDILKVKAEAIVNAANTALAPGGGVCGIIHGAAGPELARECETLGGCQVGGAKITGGYRLEQKYVIHAVGPVYDGTDRCAGLLASAYKSSLDLAKEKGIHSIAFPAISTGIFGYPKKEAARVALGALTQWFKENASYGMTIYMVAYDQETFDIYKQFAPEKKN